MARDRTAAFKGGNSSNTNAANNWEQDVQQQPNYANAASAAYPPAQPITRPDEVLLSAAKDMDTFYRQRDVLTQYINRIEYNIDQIKQLNLRSLSEVNQNAAARLKTQCEDLTAETSKLVQFTRDGVKMLHQSRKGDKNIRKGQYNFVLQKLQGVTRNFIQVENDIKLSKKDQIARQYRIAKPNATDAEIQEAIDSGRTDVFNQLMLNSRVANQQKVLGEVQDRQKELEKVLKSMSELQDIMIEMNTLINVWHFFLKPYVNTNYLEPTRND
ncbi:t-SNARE [Rhizoclosmatium globosum]|uniref:t-SNARE n=1 Tax=Rhizoclosmatium globosum TaxID=329046 RepID=A0A1Y2CE47_9FUNG|nr:t-SNARE [Rhizoclosmatium globosum]|eukprot:ORY45206.1 t-SNARE [Rhizoclosmatium globosum]